MFWGSSITGLYTAASKLPAIINMITSIFQQAWQYSIFTEIRARDNKYFFTNIFKVYTYLCVVICAGLIAINKFLCRFLLQADFYSAWKFVPLLLLAATFGCIATYFGTFYNAIKNNKMLMISTIVGALVNIFFNFLLIPSLGGLGAAIATVISYFTVIIMRILNICKFIEIEIDINIQRLTFQLAVIILITIIACFSEILLYILTILLFCIEIYSDLELMKK